MERIKKYEPLWGKWIVKRKLGEGTFGAVYEAEKIDDISGNATSCAVKLISIKDEQLFRGMNLRETLSADEWEKIKKENLKKVLKEAEVMEKLESRDHIVELKNYEHISNEKTTDILMRMELLTNLNDYLLGTAENSEIRLKKQVIKIGIDLCKGLEECEAEQIVHCDIKPENIFVNKSNTFKLGDFGLSHKFAASSLLGSMGTKMYMSPEAAGYGKRIDYRSDIYSLGIVLYELLNDRKIPFSSDSFDSDKIEDAITRRMSGEKIVYPIHERGQLWTIIQKACQFESKDRYQHASEMRRDLEKLKYEERNDSIRNDLEITIESDIGSTIEEKSYRDKSRNYQKNVKEKERESLKHQQIFNLEKKKTLEKGQKVESHNQKGSEKQEERGNRRKKVKQKSLYKAIFILVSIIAIGIALWMGYHVFFQTGVVNIPILGYLIICPLIIGGIIVVGCIYFEDEIRNMQKKLKEPKVKKSITIIIVLIQFVFGIVDLLGYYAFLSSDLTNQGAIILWVGIIILFVAIGIGICTESWLYLELISLLMGAIMVVVVYKSDIVLNVFKSIQNIGMPIDGALRMFLK